MTYTDEAETVKLKELDTKIDELIKKRRKLIRTDSRTRLVSMVPTNLNRVQFELHSNTNLMNSAKTKRTLGFFLGVAYNEYFPGKRILCINSLFDGVYYKPAKEDHVNITLDICKMFQRKILEYLVEEMSIMFTTVKIEVAIEKFMSEGCKHEAECIKSIENQKEIVLATYRGYSEHLCNGHMHQKNFVKFNFVLIPYENGIFLHHSNRYVVKSEADEKNIKSMLEMIKKYQNWAKDNFGIEYIYQLNNAVEDPDTFKRMVKLCEEKHMSEIEDLTQDFMKRYKSGNPTRILSIGGPTSSGKTTFSKRLRESLKAHGINSLYIGMDEYFLNLSDMTRDKYGCYDFEHISAVNVELLTRDVAKLLNMEQIMKRKFDFVNGAGYYTEIPLTLKSKNDVVVLEGIHGINPALSEHFKNNDEFYRICICCLNTTMNDPSNRMITSNVRLARRIVRDNMCRGSSHYRTLRMWGTVRLGEAKNIFPFMKYADYCFNSCLIYEVNVLKPYLVRLLNKIPLHPHTELIGNEISQMMNSFREADDSNIPDYSIIREFIGGSKYAD